MLVSNTPESRDVSLFAGACPSHGLIGEDEGVEILQRLGRTHHTYIRGGKI